MSICFIPVLQPPSPQMNASLRPHQRVFHIQELVTPTKEVKIQTVREYGMISPEGNTPSSQDWEVIAEEWAKTVLKQEVVDEYKRAGASRHSRAAVCMGSQQFWKRSPHRDLCKHKPGKPQTDKGGGHEVPPWARSCWHLIVLWDGEAVFSKGLTPSKSTMLQRMAVHPRIHGQHKSHLCFFKEHEIEWVRKESERSRSWGLWVWWMHVVQNSQRNNTLKEINF